MASDMAAKRKPILISGAGISSLLLAQALLRANIPIQIFERDESLSHRGQGYRLRLSPEGLDVIEKVLGPEKFLRFWETCGKTAGAGVQTIEANSGEIVELIAEIQKTKDAMAESEKMAEEVERVRREEAEKNGQVPKRTKALQEALSFRDGKVVGIARSDMRKHFLKGCENFIQWGKTVSGYELTTTGVVAIFSDGTKSVEGEVLVGGEGIHSKVAKQVSGGLLKVFDTGARGIQGQAPTTVFKGLGEGVWRIIDDENPKGRVFAVTNVRPDGLNDPNMTFGWVMGAFPGVIKAPGDNYSLIGKAAADIAKDVTKSWSPKVKILVDNMIEEEAAFWKITCSAPSGVPVWVNEPRVTVIGDAVHSMTPAGGLGGNTAVKDSELLGRLIVEAGGYADGITAEYEKQMRVYASQAVAQSYSQAAAQFHCTIDEETSLTV